MAMKKWAMVIMNAGYDPEKDMARLDLEQVETHILTVRNPEEAVALAKRLGEEGFGAIEVCGAFGEELGCLHAAADVDPAQFARQIDPAVVDVDRVVVGVPLDVERVDRMFGLTRPC